MEMLVPANSDQRLMYEEKDMSYSVKKRSNIFAFEWKMQLEEKTSAAKTLETNKKDEMEKVEELPSGEHTSVTKNAPSPEAAVSTQQKVAVASIPNKGYVVVGVDGKPALHGDGSPIVSYDNPLDAFLAIQKVHGLHHPLGEGVVIELVQEEGMFSYAVKDGIDILSEGVNLTQHGAIAAAFRNIERMEKVLSQVVESYEPEISVSKAEQINRVKTIIKSLI